MYTDSVRAEPLYKVTFHVSERLVICNLTYQEQEFLVPVALASDKHMPRFLKMEDFRANSGEVVEKVPMLFVSMMVTVSSLVSF